MDERYARFSRLLIDRPHPRLLRVVMNRPDKLNAADGQMHSELAEIWRVVASLERLGVPHKVKLGDELVRRMETRKGREDAVHLWALSRVGARVPLYGPLNLVVPPSKIKDWLTPMLGWDWPEPDKTAFAFAQLGRRTADRTRDLDDAQQRVGGRLQPHHARAVGPAGRKRLDIG